MVLAVDVTYGFGYDLSNLLFVIWYVQKSVFFWGKNWTPLAGRNGVGVGQFWGFVGLAMFVWE
jgi:hypothetical protein